MLIDGRLQDHSAYGDQDILQSKRDSQAALLGDNLFSEIPVVFFKLHDIHFCQGPQAVEKRQELSCDGSHGSSDDAPVEHKYKQ